MPKEYQRSASNVYRTTPMVLPSDTSSGTRVTSIWSPEDDNTLMEARSSGLNWQPIAAKHFPNKTANACRKRHERLMERRNAEDWDGEKLETLATEYMAVRREMWSVLADRVGEKWQIIEAKVGTNNSPAPSLFCAPANICCTYSALRKGGRISKPLISQRNERNEVWKSTTAASVARTLSAR
jgi:hypothetical protein